MEHTEPGWQFQLIENGKTCASVTLDGGTFTTRSVLRTGLTTVSFQRVEVYDETGMCILLTNPIYIVKSDEAAFEIPNCRLAEREGRQ